MNSKAVGGVLLIVGTSIGAGMLALPVANASLGFWSSNVLLIACWAVMALGAFFVMEASLYVTRGQHLISMAKVTLGTPGLLATGGSYLLLLYALLSAYISGGADVLGSLLTKLEVHLPDFIHIILFTLIFGVVVYQGIRPVDWVNRVLMFGKLGVYILLVGLIMPFVSPDVLAVYHWQVQSSLMMILITSFGFAIIVPNLRDYFEQDRKLLLKVLLVGSMIPLCCYILWDYVILGSLATSGVVALQKSQHTISELAQLLTTHTQSHRVLFLFNLFTAVCMVTAFLGVSLSLMSFLSDMFKLTPQGLSGLFLFLITFLPPTLVVLYWPGAYLFALSYAGGFCIILLMLLPAIMCIQGRKRFPKAWKVPGGNGLPWFLGFLAVALLIFELYS